jgi:outer membrane receptor for ferrienterochelin and colicins
MKLLIVMMTVFVTVIHCNGQNTITINVKDAETSEPLVGATVQIENTTYGASTDGSGTAKLINIPDGQYVLVTRLVGYGEQERSLDFPAANNSTIEIFLESGEELEEVVITTTRSSRSIQNIPTRVEFIGGEELDEKITMQPGNIRMVLSESTGIQTQQTSVSSGNSTIRIQGLDGRYTQLLKDGFPLYSGFSGGLSIMQIPPLDLKQADVIKGSASTLYGGGAIAGLINLISKQPEDDPELSFLLNGTSAAGVDASSFYAQQFKKVGVTFFGSYNYSKEYDPAGIGFSALPNYKRYTINPRLFFTLSEKSKLIVGINTALEDRIGGDMKVLQGKQDETHLFFEQNKTDRMSTQLHYTLQLGDNQRIAVKNSFNIFNRDLLRPAYSFGGRQRSSFSEVTYEVNQKRSDWVMGLNLWTDNFSETQQTGINARDFNSTVTGTFAQNTFSINDHVILESGLRFDFANISSPEHGSRKDVFILPRVSALFRINRSLTSRVGGGLGYKTPTIFTEKAEEQVFNNVRPIDLNSTESERSYGVNGDINFQTALGDDWSFSINQLFFYTNLQKPLVFNADSLIAGVYYFENANGHNDALGVETNIKIGFKDFKLFWGYTFVNAENHFEGSKREVPLTAKHRINAVLMYEVEEKLRLGLESFYFSPQKLTNGFTTPDYWILGFSAQYNWEHLSVFVNFENFTDTRQTRFGSIYSGSISNPEFSEIYAPLDGFVFNAGCIIRLYAHEHH